MSMFSLFRRQSSAPIARERLQILLEYERKLGSQPEFAAIARYKQYFANRSGPAIEDVA